MTLHIVSTPIGNLKDITLRSLETLKIVDYIICEDTRVSSKLLKHYNINTKLVFYNDHNAPKIRPQILEDLRNNKTLALISDAGTPLISDPGYKLINDCEKYKIKIEIEPGPTAVIPALILSGFPPHPYFFGGFFDKKLKKELKNLDATLVFFESAKRIEKTLRYLEKENIKRQVSISREITKKFEESIKGNLTDVIERLEKTSIKGEITFCLSPPTAVFDEKELEVLIKKYGKNRSTKETSKIVSEITGQKVNTIYKLAQTLKSKETS